jgi:hypothetical protein
MDQGPWLVNQWSPKHEGGRPRVVLQSDDFTYDAALEISGDFGSLEKTLEYATWLAGMLNGLPCTRPLDWLKQLQNARKYPKDPATCKHEISEGSYETFIDEETGEDYMEYVVRTSSLYKDLDVGRFRCTDCGHTGYYTGLWKRFFEEGIPCPGSDRHFNNKPPKD